MTKPRARTAEQNASRFLSRRTKAALAAAGGRGVALGAPGRERYGYQRVDGKLVEHPGEQAVIARARALYATGMSIAAVCSALAGEGRLNRAGKRFGTEAMHAILRR